MNRHDHLFTLRVALSKGFATIYAFDAYQTDSTGHSRIDVEVRHEGKTIFPRGAMWCGTPSHVTVDGKAAKALVLLLVAMQPGDTDADYFASYTPEQIAWAEEFGDELNMAREARYGEDS
jgi:hypothetical protein